MLQIRSTSSNRALHIQPAVGGYCPVELAGHEVAAVTQVWIDTDLPDLVRFFVDLGSTEAPWRGARDWHSLEDDLSISATCSSLGVVVFRVRLLGSSGAPEQWSVEAGIETEFGQLAAYAERAKGLLNAGAI